MAVIFLDVADVLGRLTGRTREGRVQLQLDVFPGVRDWLGSLAEHRVGVLWSGPAVSPALAAAGLMPYFAPELLIFEELDFSQAVTLAGVPAEQCVWVSSDGVTRRRAIEVGLRASPHQALVRPILAGEMTCFLEVATTARLLSDLERVPFVPMVVTDVPTPMTYGVSTRTAATTLEAWGYAVRKHDVSGAPEWSDVSFLPASRIDLPLLRHRPLPADLFDGLITPEAIARDVERYSSEAIFSRDIRHPGNVRAAMQAFEDFAGLDPAFHYFRHQGLLLVNVEAVLPGESAEAICISAHFDSTAGDESEPSTARSPGADDDASGVAGVLAIARAFQTLGGGHFTYRFVLLNAEESGCGGSRHYVRSLPGPVRADFQLDTIGFASPGRRFASVIYTAGHAAMVEPSRRLTDAMVSRDLTLHVWDDFVNMGTNSDHTSFHAAGIPAVLIAADRFGGGDRNPNFHTPRDTFIDADYATSIVRAVAGAAWSLCDEHGDVGGL